MSEAPPMFKTDELPALAQDAAARVGLPDPAIAYDYFKSMVSLSVGTLGGILTLGETVFGARVAPWQTGLAALSIAISGLVALQGKTDITQMCQGIKPPMNSSRAALRVVPALYGLGLGLFLMSLVLSYLDPAFAARLR